MVPVMLAGDKPLTVAARPVGPYLHADNRGLVIFDGGRCVLLPATMLPWVAETLGILLEEKRATRHRGDINLGGFIAEDGATATLYAGPASDMATLQVPVDVLQSLRDGLGGR